jgi:hypothetical protein
MSKNEKGRIPTLEKKEKTGPKNQGLLICKQKFPCKPRISPRLEEDTQHARKVQNSRMLQNFQLHVMAKRFVAVVQ